MRHRYILFGGLAIVLFVALLVAVGWYRTKVDPDLQIRASEHRRPLLR